MKKVFSWSVAACVTGIAVCSLSACLTIGDDRNGFQRPETVGADNPFATPQSFLRSGFGPLDEWLDGRFDVSYLNLRLGGGERENVFAQRPIEEVHYRFESVGRSGTLFHLEALSISRREILYRIAKTYDLRMTIENVNGKPAYISVVGNQPGSRFNPAEVLPDEGAVREF